MIDSRQGDQQLIDLFEQIDDYWSFQKNNEIYVKNLNLVPGTQEYFDVIQKARYRYLYYLDDMISWLKGSTGNRLIEVGCGMGMDLAQLSEAGFEVTGVDLAQTHVALAKAYFKQKGLVGEIRHGNAEYLDYEDETFDCAYSFGVLHHSPNPQIGINEIHRVLKPGGRSSVMLYHRHSLNNLVHLLTRIPYDNPKDVRPFGKDANFVFRYSRANVREMFHKFSHLDVKVEYAYGAGWEPVYSWTPRVLYKLLSKVAGWHLVIYAQK